MGSLKSYINITERKEDGTNPRKVAVIAFGRFQPPTRGHMKIVDKVKEVAGQKGGNALIFPSQSHDLKGRNPLEWNEKIQLMRELMPNTTIVQNPKAKNAWSALEVLEEEGYTEVYMVCGSDRVAEYERRWLPYATEAFEHAEVISAGSRDPDDEVGVQGMSGTRAREAAAEGDLGKFRAATGWTGSAADKLMAAVKKGLPGE